MSNDSKLLYTQNDIIKSVINDDVIIIIMELLQVTTIVSLWLLYELAMASGNDGSLRREMGSGGIQEAANLILQAFDMYREQQLRTDNRDRRGDRSSNVNSTRR